MCFSKNDGVEELDVKWQHKGHEYDNVYEHIAQKESYYLFGAGDYGHQFYPVMRDEIKIIGYIDNDEYKAGTVINDLPCVNLEKVRCSKDTGIIVTMSQIARISAIEQLNEMGLKKNRDYFLIEEFISVYFAYKYQQVVFSNISFLPSTACNLNCRYCLNFNPFSKTFYVRELEHLKADIDVFFRCVDRVMLFHVSGGETLLYPNIGEVVEYLHGHYGNRIDKLRMVTNGTIVPRDDVLRKLADANVEVTVDDYREAVPDKDEQFKQVIQKLNEYEIRHYVNKVSAWVDLGPDVTDYSGCPESWLIKHRSECDQNWQELRDGKLYSCNYAAYAVVTGKLGKQDLEETYDLREHSQDKLKELIEFHLGYTEKGYTNFCKYCRGFTTNNTADKSPALQTEIRNMMFICNRNGQ